MSAPKHTAGPWAVEDPMDHGLTIVANPDAPVYKWKWVAMCDWPTEDEQSLTSAEVKANARLIAAAPDYDAAARRIADDYQTSETHHPNHVLIRKADFEALLAAIAKATGAGAS